MSVTRPVKAGSFALDRRRGRRFQDNELTILEDFMTGPLSFIRLRGDANGGSHFENLAIDLYRRDFAPPATPFGVSEFTPASQCGFLRLPPGWVGDMHPSPMRMWVFFLAGQMEFETSNGEKRRCGPGTAMLLEDIAGRGHRSRVTGDADAVLAAVRL
jgi:hypothetical protein